jgi:hypothetical protein
MYRREPPVTLRPDADANVARGAAVGVVGSWGSALIYPIVLTVAGGLLAMWRAPFDWWDPRRPSRPGHHRGQSFATGLEGGLLGSLKVAATTTTLAILIALPLAVLAGGTGTRSRGVERGRCWCR